MQLDNICSCLSFDTKKRASINVCLERMSKEFNCILWVYSTLHATFVSNLIVINLQKHCFHHDKCLYILKKLLESMLIKIKSSYRCLKIDLMYTQFVLPRIT